MTTRIQVATAASSVGSSGTDVEAVDGCRRRVAWRADVDIERDHGVDARRRIARIEGDRALDAVLGEEGEGSLEQVRALGQAEGAVERRETHRRCRAEEERAVVNDDERQAGSLGGSPFGPDGRPMGGAEPHAVSRAAPVVSIASPTAGIVPSGAMGPNNPWSPSGAPIRPGRGSPGSAPHGVARCWPASPTSRLRLRRSPRVSCRATSHCLSLAIGSPGVALLGAGLAPAALGSKVDAVAVGLAFALGCPVAAVTSIVIGAFVLGLLRAG